MRSGTKIGLLAVTTICAVSSVLFFKQGGFGGGHGDFDKIIILGLPWAPIPWPEFLTNHDFVWLIGLPFVLNVATVFAVTAMVRIVGRRGSGSVSQKVGDKV